MPIYIRTKVRELAENDGLLTNRTMHPGVLGFPYQQRKNYEVNPSADGLYRASARRGRARTPAREGRGGGGGAAVGCLDLKEACSAGATSL